MVRLQLLGLRFLWWRAHGSFLHDLSIPIGAILVHIIRPFVAEDSLKTIFRTCFCTAPHFKGDAGRETRDGRNNPGTLFRDGPSRKRTENCSTEAIALARPSKQATGSQLGSVPLPKCGVVLTTVFQNCSTGVMLSQPKLPAGEIREPAHALTCSPPDRI